MIRVALGDEDLARFVHRGFDQWLRLAIPVDDRTRFDNLPDTFDFKGFLRYLTLPRGTKPVIRNYTVRQVRCDPDELDIDSVVHGDDGVAGPWAASVEPGAEIAFLDQGCGRRAVSAGERGERGRVQHRAHSYSHQQPGRQKPHEVRGASKGDQRGNC